MQCEICGKKGEVFNVLVEGSEMEVCDKCSEFGSALKKEVKEIFVKNTKSVLVVDENYSGIIKSAREKIGWKQSELASRMGIKESIVHKVESGINEPSIELAEKFEKIFNIKLIGSYSEKKEFNSVESKGVTIGDLLKEKN